MICPDVELKQVVQLTIPWKDHRGWYYPQGGERTQQLKVFKCSGNRDKNLLVDRLIEIPEVEPVCYE